MVRKRCTPVQKAAALENADLGAAEAVDRLVVVPDHGQVPLLAGEQLQQPVLGVVGVLVLVHQDPAEALR